MVPRWFKFLSGIPRLAPNETAHYRAVYEELRLVFDNDDYQPPEDRNLWVGEVVITRQKSIPSR